MASSNQAQYAIDIAASMTGGAKTIAELDALTTQLMGAGKDSEFFKDALATVSNELDVAANSAKVANAALAEGETAFREVEKAALQAAKAAEKAALANGGIVPRDLFDKAEAARRALTAETDALKKLESAAASATSKHDKLRTTIKNLNDLNKHVGQRLGEAASKTSAFAGALGDLGGPLGSVGQRVLAPVKGFADLAEKFSVSTAVTAAVVVGVAAVTAAVVALSAAAAAGVVAVAAWGVSLADAGRNAKLANEAFASLSESNLVAVDTFKGVTAATGLGADKLRDLTKKLTAAKVSADDMPAALRAAATAEAALGQGGADQFVADITKAKGEVGKLASAVQAKFGGVVARQMLGLEAQGARLRTNIGETFGGLDIEPLLEGMTTLVNLFDENTASGKALKFLFESLVQPLIDGFTKAIPLIEAFFLGFLIGAVKVYIALKPVIKAVSEFLGFDDETSAETFKSFAKAGEYVGYVIAALVVAFGVIAAVVLPVVAVALAAVVAAIIVVGAAIAGLVAGAVWLGVKFWELAKAVGGAIAAVYSAVVSGLTAAIDFVASLPERALAIGLQIIQSLAAGVSAAAGALSSAFASDFSSVFAFLAGIPAQALTIGAQIMQGLANGILGAAGAVVSAISGAVSAAINKAKSLLGIASPSKVFGEIGGFTGEGFAVGVEKEAPAAQAAMAEMVAPPAPGEIPQRAIARVASPTDGGAPVGTSSDGSGGSATPGGSLGGVNLDGVTFNFYGVENAESAEPALRKALLELLSGQLIEAGGATS